MIEQGVFYLGGGDSIRKGGEVVGKSSQGPLFDGPYGTWGGRG